MWREKLRQIPNAADMIFLEALEREGLTRFGGFKFDDYLFLPVAKPEAQWTVYQVCAYLDGPPHLKDKQRADDEFIDAVLTRHGWMPLRFSYRPPLSQRQLAQIINQVKGVLREKEASRNEA